MKPFHEVVLPCRTTHGKFFLHHVLRGQEHDPYHHYLCKDNAVGFYPLEMNQIFICSSWRPQLSTELCGCSHLTEDHGKVYMDAGMLQLHNPLQKKTHTLSADVKHTTHKPSLTCGIRFFWILFSLDFLRPFLVTTVSS